MIVIIDRDPDIKFASDRESGLFVRPRAILTERFITCDHILLFLLCFLFSVFLLYIYLFDCGKINYLNL